jgi:putative oxidoreductase
MEILALIARILFAQMFIMSGMTAHLAKREQTVPYAASQGVPAAGFLVPFSGILIIAGGLMIALGIFGDLGALIIIGFLLPTALWMHAFWKIEDQQEQANQMAHFLKNVVMAGGALLMFVFFAYFGHGLGLTITDPLFDLR